MLLPLPLFAVCALQKLDKEMEELEARGDL
jgi:hypothetical protein